MILTLCPNPSVDKILQVNHFHLGQVNKCTSDQSFPGGKGVHVAMALKELGNDSKIIGFFGGPTGEWIRDECTKLGIACLGPNLTQWTRTCITLHTNSEANNTEILENGPKIDTEALDEFFGVTRTEISDAEAICISGSWPVNSPKNVYETLKSICDLHHKELWVDASGK
ncbi:MAG: PfkB family carbohydrate kinase, partial [Candidatus Paceibacterota bacterium]